MKTLLLKIDYRDNTGKFWFDSSVKNKTVKFDPEKQTIHELIKDVCDEEGMTLSYNAKPQGNIFRDDKEGNSVITGYLYRGRSEIYDRDMRKPQTGYFDVWVSIREVTSFEFEEIG